MANRKSGTRSRRQATKPKSEGLGDTVEKITEATGINAAVKWFSDKTGIDCGCDERKEKLNKMFPYHKPECMTQEEYEYYKSVRGNENITYEDRVKLYAMYNRIFHTYQKVTSCNKCMRDVIIQLERIYETYEA